MRLLISLFILLSCAYGATAQATPQIQDMIKVDGITAALKDEPLKGYLEQRNITFKPAHSGNWRGYVAYWTLTDKILLLDDVVWAEQSYLPKITWMRGNAFSNTYTPKHPLPRKAAWYSGTLVIGLSPKKDVGPYALYEQSYDRFLQVTVKQGTVVNKQTLSAHEMNMRPPLGIRAP